MSHRVRLLGGGAPSIQTHTVEEWAVEEHWVTLVFKDTVRFIPRDKIQFFEVPNLASEPPADADET